MIDLPTVEPEKFFQVGDLVKTNHGGHEAVIIAISDHGWSNQYSIMFIEDGGRTAWVRHESLTFVRHIGKQGIRALEKHFGIL